MDKSYHDSYVRGSIINLKSIFICFKLLPSSTSKLVAWAPAHPRRPTEDMLSASASSMGALKLLRLTRLAGRDTLRPSSRQAGSYTTRHAVSAASSHPGAPRRRLISGARAGRWIVHPSPTACSKSLLLGLHNPSSASSRNFSQSPPSAVSVAVGDRYQKVRAFTQQDVDEFAKVSGDHNPLHQDSEVARRSGDLANLPSCLRVTSASHTSSTPALAPASCLCSHLFYPRLVFIDQLALRRPRSARHARGVSFHGSHRDFGARLYLPLTGKSGTPSKADVNAAR